MQKAYERVKEQASNSFFSTLSRHNSHTESSTESRGDSDSLPNIDRTHSRESSSTAVQYPRWLEASAFAKRVHGWSWQAFPVGMGTSAVYLSLSGWSEKFRPRDYIEYIFFWLTLVLFVLNTTTLLLQAILYPSRAKALLTDPHKGVFFPLLSLSLATIIIGFLDDTYGFWRHACHQECAFSLFWFYTGFAVLTSLPMLFHWYDKPHPLREFSPTFVFPIFPMMLVGVVAFNSLKNIDPYDKAKSLSILLTGYIFQGTISSMPSRLSTTEIRTAIAMWSR